MNRYLVCVELHNATEEDYKTLHAEMKNQGFGRTIDGDKGEYHLPTAEYYKRSKESRVTEFEKVKLAADKTKKKYGAIIAECVGLTWVGLEKVK